MPCGLSDDELFILHNLYSSRCVSSSRSKNLKLLEGIYKHRTNDLKRKMQEHEIEEREIEDLDRIIHNLVMTGYIAPIKKKDPKYYISDLGKAMHALCEHRYKVTQGRERSL